MKHLLYGIIRHVEAPLFPGVVLPSKTPFRVIPSQHLAAVVSDPTADNCSKPSLAELIAFEKDVAAIHELRTVVPVRYGCWMGSTSEIVTWLDARKLEYETLLTHLDGMTEMGVRVILPERSRVEAPPPASPGAAYMAALRSRSDAGSTLSAEESALVKRVTGFLSGFCAEQRWEVTASAQTRLLSVYFLVPKARLDAFRTSR